MNARLNVLLFIAVIASGLYLVHVSARARNLFVELEKAQNEEHALETQYEQLQVDKRAQATPLRVEKVAREKLNMRTASASVTQYVTYSAAAASAPATAAAAPAPAQEAKR